LFHCARQDDARQDDADFGASKGICLFVYSEQI
jgi:hypothetical protein